MKLTIITAAAVLAITSGAAFAQPSQAQGGGATGPTSNSQNSANGVGSSVGGNTTTSPGMTRDTMAPSSSTTSGNSMGGSSAPSSQGNVGPGTTNNSGVR